MNINELPQEILYNILLKLDYTYLITNCSLVNRNWKNFIKGYDLPIHYCREFIEGYPHITTRNSTEIEFCKTVLTTTQNGIHIPLKAISASSTDHLSQHVAFTIAEFFLTFWSSKGSISENDDELIVYEIGSGVAVLKFLKITFFKANWLPEINGRRPCFASKSIRIEINNEKGDKLYVSPIFDVIKSNNPQLFYLPKPFFVNEGYKIKLHLFGKLEKELTDNKFYTCVHNFEIFGISNFIFPFQFKNGIFMKYSDEEFKLIKHNISYAKNILYKLADYIFRFPNSTENPRILFYLEQLGQLNSVISVIE